MPVGYTLRYDPGDIDGRVLLLATHHVKAQSFFRLWQFHHPWVGMALTRRERCNCGLDKINKTDFYFLVKWTRFIVYYMITLLRYIPVRNYGVQSGVYYLPATKGFTPLAWQQKRERLSVYNRIFLNKTSRESLPSRTGLEIIHEPT